MSSTRFLEAAARDLAGLDASAARRILPRIRWLAENIENIRPEALTGDLAGLYKLRVGITVSFTKSSVISRLS